MQCGEFPVVQWLRLGIFTAVAQVQSLVRELRPPRPCKPHGVARKRKKKRCDLSWVSVQDEQT